VLAPSAVSADLLLLASYLLVPIRQSLIDHLKLEPLEVAEKAVHEDQAACLLYLGLPSYLEALRHDLSVHQSFLALLAKDHQVHHVLLAPYLPPYH